MSKPLRNWQQERAAIKRTPLTGQSIGYFPMAGPATGRRPGRSDRHYDRRRRSGYPARRGLDDHPHAA